MDLYIKRSIFDLLKIGIGPSSSHTMGPMQMAREFREELLQKDLKPNSLRVILYGSLASTGEGHLTPNAILAGLQGMDAIDTPVEEIQNATSHLILQGGFFLGEHRIETPQGLELIEFDRSTTQLTHPNTARFRAIDEHGGVLLDRSYCSIGGGVIVELENLQEALEDVDEQKLSLVEILHQCDQLGLSLVEWNFRQEELLTSMSREEIREKLRALWQVMGKTVDAGLSQEGLLPGKLNVRRRAKRAFQRNKKRSTPLGQAVQTFGKAGIYALAVSEQNACGGRLVTAPTCGACGVVPGVLTMMHRELEMDEEEILDGLALAGLIGNIVVDRASISGAEVGCQGEVGVACAMASAAAAALCGASNAQIEESAEAALEHHLGLTCDPIMGLVQVPCIERNAIAAGTAINSANLALMGEGNHLISFDKCVDTMLETGREMNPKYKETALGGLATTHC